MADDLPLDSSAAVAIDSGSSPASATNRTAARAAGSAGVTPAAPAAAGPTRGEAVNAFALSPVRHGRLDPDPLWEAKAKRLAARGPSTLHGGGPGFGSLGGLNARKEFRRAALINLHAVAEPEGVLLLGPPGEGKSAFAKALGSEVGRPTPSLDVVCLMGGPGGATEENTPPGAGDCRGDGVVPRAFHR